MFPDFSWEGKRHDKLSDEEDSAIWHMGRLDRMLVKENDGRDLPKFENKPALFYHVYKDVCCSYELRIHALRTLCRWIFCYWKRIKAIWNDLDLFCGCLFEDILGEKDERFLEDLCDLLCFFGCKRGDEWPKGKQFVAKCSFSSNSRLQNIAMRSTFFDDQSWSTRWPSLFDVKDSNVKQLIVHSILYSVDELLRNACRALLVYLRRRDFDMLSLFPSLIPKIIEIASETGWHSTLSCIDDLAEHCIDLLAAHVDRIVAVCNKKISRNCDDSGVYILLYFYYEKPTWIHPKHIPGMIFSSILAILNEKDEREVVKVRDGEYGKEPLFFCHSETGIWHVRSAIRHFGKDLMGKQLLAIVYEYLQQDDWKIRAAAMRALGSVVEYDREDGGLGPEAVAEIADMAICSLTDSQPRVVYEGCSCMNELISHYPEHLDEAHFGRFFSAIMAHRAEPRLSKLNVAIGWLLFRITNGLPRQLQRLCKNLMEVHFDGLRAILQSIIRSMQMECCVNNQSARKWAFHSICSLRGYSRYFPEILLDYAKGNPRHIVHIVPASDETCFACYEKVPDVVIRKSGKCSSSCGSCACPPRWCIGCIAQIYLAKRSPDCPFCRQTFCQEDILFVEAALE